MSLGPLQPNSSFTVTLPLLASPAAFYTHVVSSLATVTLPLLNSAAAFFDFDIHAQVTLPFLASPAAFYTIVIASHVDVALDLLASPAAFYPMVVAGPVTLPLLASPAAFYTMELVYTRIISLPFLGTVQQLYAMVVAGPVTLPLLASPATFYAMTITQPQEVTLPFLDSPATFELLYISLVQLVTLPFLDSPATFGDHTITGGLQRVRLDMILSPARFWIPTVSGGPRTIRIFVGGIDRTKWLVPMSANFDQQQLGRWNGGFDFYIDDGSWAPVLFQTVLVMDYGRRHFFGSISEIKLDRAPKTLRKTFFRCQAIDTNGLLDHRVVFKTYTADQDAADVVRDLVINFLDGEGITTFAVPDSLGPLGVDLVLNYDTATASLDKIRDTGAIRSWWVDSFGDLHTNGENDEPLTAPIALTQTSKNWRNLSTRWTTIDFATEAFVRTNLTLKAGDQTQTGPSRTDTFTLPQQTSVDRGFVFGAIVLPVSAFTITEVKVNGVVKPLFTLVDFVDWNRVWCYVYQSPYLTPPVEGPDVPGIGDVVQVTYVPWIQNVAVNQGPVVVPTPPGGLGPLPPGADGTAGSGRIQVVLQVNDISSQADADALALAYQTRKNQVPVEIEFETDWPGCEVGQLLPVDLPLIYLPNALLLITAVSGRSLAVNLGHSSTFRWTIRALLGPPDLGNWMRWFERLVRRSDHALPIYQYEDAEFVLAPDGSLAAGLLETNPGFVKRTGRLVECWLAFTNPPADQDAVVDILADGVSILGPHKIRVPAGSHAIAVTTEFATFGLYLYERQLLRAEVSYAVTGPNPLPAANGTLMVRWAI